MHCSNATPRLADAVAEYHRVNQARREAALAAVGAGDVAAVPLASRAFERLAATCRQAVRTAKRIDQVLAAGGVRVLSSDISEIHAVARELLQRAEYLPTDLAMVGQAACGVDLQGAFHASKLACHQAVLLSRKLMEPTMDESWSWPREVLIEPIALAVETAQRAADAACVVVELIRELAKTSMRRPLGPVTREAVARVDADISAALIKGGD